METSNSQVLDIREQAKARALKVISSTPGAVSFVNTQELETQSLFVPVVTILRAGPDDFHNLRGGAKMPKSHYTNQIAEATGVNILDVRVVKSSEFIWQGHADGERRMPDGTMRKGSGEYEFDAEKRAEEDWIAKPDDYKSEIAKRRHVLEYARFGMQRASSGARLALIRYLAGIPTGFNQENIQKAMIFCRVDRNVDGVLADPTMRQAALGQLLGAKDAVFGPSTPPLSIEMKDDAPLAEPARRFDHETGEEIQPAAAPAADPDQADLFEDDPPPEPVKPKPDPVAQAKDRLRAYLQKMLPEAAIRAVNAMLDNPAATVAEIEQVIGKCDRTMEARVKKQAGAA